MKPLILQNGQLAEASATTLSGYGITDAQGLDSDLTALAGLSSNGLIARTADGAAATRTITGTANQVTVTNGDGVSGNPTLSLPQSIATTSTVQFARIGVGTPADNAQFEVVGSDLPVVSIVRTTSTTNTTASGLRLIARSSGDMVDGFGALVLVYAEDNGTVSPQPLGGFGSFRDGADNCGGFSIRCADLGAFVERVRVSSAGAIRLNSYGAGTLKTDSSGNVTASSDASLKTVTGSFIRGLADVLKLTPRTYRWNEKSGMDTEDENVGFIAQEVLDAVPEAVGQYRTSEVEVDGKKTKKREKAELLTLSDRPLIAALVNAVKELKAENDALSARIAALENGKAAK